MPNVSDTPLPSAGEQISAGSPVWPVSPSQMSGPHQSFQQYKSHWGAASNPHKLYSRPHSQGSHPSSHVLRAKSAGHLRHRRHGGSATGTTSASRGSTPSRGPSRSGSRPSSGRPGSAVPRHLARSSADFAFLTPEAAALPKPTPRRGAVQQAQNLGGGGGGSAANLLAALQASHPALLAYSAPHTGGRGARRLARPCSSHSPNRTHHAH